MNKQLKNIKSFTYLLLVFAALLNFGCEKDEYVDRRNEKNRVKVIVRSNTPQVPVLVSYGEGDLYIKDYWESEFSTTAYVAGVSARCEDRYTLLTVEVYVNGKLKSKADGNNYVTTSTRVKYDRR